MTAVLYGFALDSSIAVVGLIPAAGMIWRLVFYAVGLVLCSVGVAFFFHTYISPEAYELFVKEISEKYGTNISKTKTIYDCISCLVGVILSFVFFSFGHFEGVKIGTILCALINGWLIGRISSRLEQVFEFKDAFGWRDMFAR